ncbi:hypothetical protein B0J18DRAFT_159472 [Chaetomium sp. MPI-SDFR-AT-0129]|nr:hypothetical protein B0J18DRAFT_159472 [Chaetomium sp. MPI-SDFR-AT-0129]
MPLPDFTSPTLFPSFLSLPIDTEPPPESSSETFLLAQILENMTLTKPTLICTDVPPSSPTTNNTTTTTNRFAIVFPSRPGSGPDTLDFRRLGYKKGSTLVIRGARRRVRGGGAGASASTAVSEEELPDSNSQPGGGSGSGREVGFVAVERADEGLVSVVPTGVGKVRELGVWLRERDEKRLQQGGGGEGVVFGCETCGRMEGTLLKKCTGCGEVAYCGKECQLRGWDEGGHKGDCKAIKAIRAIWP